MKTIKNTIVLLMIGGLLFSSTERVNALGGNAAFWPEDEANISVFPQAVNNFNLANTDGEDFYVSWGDDMKFGFSGGTSSDLVNLSWGMNNMGLNFGLNMTPEVEAVECAADDSDCVEVEGVEGVSIINTQFGMTLDGVGDVGVHFMNSTMHDHGDHFDYEDGMTLGLTLRRAQELWVFSHALVNFNYEDPTDEDAVMNLGADLFTHLDIAENTTGLFAMGFGYTNEGEDGDIHFPKMTFAVESAWTDWATVRAGFTKDWSLTNTSSAGVTPNFGLGFNYGSFVLDMSVGSDIFTNPVQKVTGFDSLNASSFNLTYMW
ncbi:MAG: hypothetical protein CMF96_10515 [Candidatus Marinimicrobia bacterium]|nr:hypothetical protein [Candidatus Neomarinimicrobiota bacterium]